MGETAHSAFEVGAEHGMRGEARCAGGWRWRLADSQAPGSERAAVGAGGVIAQVEGPSAPRILAVEP